MGSNSEEKRELRDDEEEKDDVTVPFEKFEPEIPSEKGSLRPQYIAATVANLAAMVAGCVLGWTSPTLPLLEDTGYMNLTKEEESWIGSLVPVGAAVGPFPAGFAADRFGHKKALLATAVPYILSWILISAAKSSGLLYFARLLAGISVGATFAIVPMYVGEISEDHVRGALGSFTQILVTIGFIYVYSIGPYVSFVSLGVACTVVAVLFLVSMFFVPDSPLQLLKHGHRQDSQKALQWLRSKTANGVKHELDILQNSVDRAANETSSIRDLIATKGSIKALYLSLGLIGFQQLSGINAVLFFSQTIFDMSGGSLDPSIATIIIGVVMLLASCCTPLVVDRLGRRILMLVSSIGSALALGVLGWYFYKKLSGADTSCYDTLPVASLIIYIIVYSIGFGPLPWAIMGELFKSNVKSKASSLTASFCWILGFIITKFFQNIVDSMGASGAFWIFSICCIVAAIFIYFLLPETKGKSLQEIQDILEDR